MALRQMKRVLALESIRRVVALKQIMGVVHHHAHIGTTRCVRQLQTQATSQAQGPVLTTFYNGCVMQFTRKTTFIRAQLFVPLAFDAFASAKI